MHADRNQFRRAMICVVFRVNLRELDDLSIGKRRGVFYQLNEFTRF